jgi:hypothetical protein
MDLLAVTLGGVPTAAAAVDELFTVLDSGAVLVTAAVLLTGVPFAAAGSIVTLRIQVAAVLAGIDEMEQVTVPFVPAGGVEHDQPGTVDNDVNRNGAGSTSVIVTTGASLGPLWVTTIVYCSAPPGTTSPGSRVFVILRSKATADCTLAEAKSFAGTESKAEETVAVMAIGVSAGVEDRTRETTVNVAAVEGFIEPVSEQLTVPFDPTEGVVQLQPAGAENETKVVSAGRGRSTVAALAVLGPLFVAVIVQVTFDPAFTGFGVAESIALKSVEG